MSRLALMVYVLLGGLVVSRERLRTRWLAGQRERGDLPGWVMIAVMTAAIVVALIPFAGAIIRDAFKSAVDTVTKTSAGP